MRTFIAIDLPQTVLDALQALSQRLRHSGAQASWVQVHNIHLTLRFLGEIEPEAAQTLGNALADRYAPMDAFRLRVSGLGAFPNMRKPSVIWAGIGPIDTGLTQVQAIAEEESRRIGVSPETRAFCPHLTLARIRDPKHLGCLIDFMKQEAAFDAGEFLVDHVSLYSSQLTPRGAVYTELRRCPFRSIP